MGYQDALEAVGYVVLEFKEFGSYQGDWIALVKKGNEVGFISDCYGSCSHCDAFQADCDGTPQGLIDFGTRYVDAIETREQLQKRFEKTSSWDMEANELLTWLNEIEPIRLKALFRKDVENLLNETNDTSSNNTNKSN